jgi:hypothetical protein
MTAVIIKFSRQTTRLSRDVATHLNLNEAFAAHRAARAIRLKMGDEAPDDEYNAAHNAEMAEMDAAVDAPCAGDDAFFAGAAYVLEVDEEEAAVAFLRNYLAQRQA